MARKRQEASSAELTFDMTPMIDVVFQLIIFFMVVLSFKKEEVEAGLVLPVAEAAKPQAKEQEELFVVNVLCMENRQVKDDGGNVIGRNPPYVMRGRPLTRDEIKRLLEEKAALSKARSDTKAVEAAVIIRGDRDTSWVQMLDAMKMCTEAEFYKVYLKTLTRTPGG